MCELCRLIVHFSWVANFSSTGNWDRLENFLISRDRPVSNNVTNAICQS